MPFYVKRGDVPAKRHIAFYKEDGKSLYREEHFSTKGFSGIYSNKYHLEMPTRVKEIRELPKSASHAWPEAPLSYFHFRTDKKKTPGNYITARTSYLENKDCTLSTAWISEPSDTFFRNAYAHEILFVHYGEGCLHSEYGNLPFGPGDYLVVPKGNTYRMSFSSFDKVKLFIIESTTPFDIPKHFRNEYGQLNEFAPYCERDFRVPDFVPPCGDWGNYSLVLKAGDRVFDYTLDHHPFDVVGWDGFVYPYAFNIKEYAPVVGKIHLPPPVHLVFTTQSFVVCNFVPRLFDFHPQSIPAPYYHSNVDSDEVLYYVEGNFMSRSGVEEGSVTLHPMGIPHGPQPGKTEASIGKKDCHEYAVMIDTFAPLAPTSNVRETMDQGYPHSWLS